jgi:tetratricopeptide (TPR) repeat protein
MNLLKLANYYCDFETARGLDYAREAVEATKYCNSSAWIRTAYSTIVNQNILHENFDTALKYVNIALKVADKMKDRRMKAGTLINKGSVYSGQGKYPKAVETFLSSARLCDELNDQSNVARCYHNIGLIYFNQRLMSSALEYYKKALAIKLKIQDSSSLGSSVGNIGIVYAEMGKPDSSISYFSRALSIYETRGDIEATGRMYDNIANIFVIKQDYKMAKKFFLKSLEIKEKFSNAESLANTYTNMSIFFSEIGDHLQALEYLNKAQEIQSKTGVLDFRIHENLASVYFKMKKYDKAYLSLFKCIKAKDSLFSSTSTKQIAEMNTKYETEKKEKEILLLNKDNELKKVELEKGKTLMYSVSGIAVLIFAFLIAVFAGFRNKQKANRKLALLNKEINEQKNEIIDSITYAKRLQEAILPPESLWKKHLPESFVLYIPKAIVAGDFYWMESNTDTVMFAAADCTGHGVPGAMVSVVCSNALNRSVHEFKLNDPGRILDKTRDLVLETFSKSGQDVKDGMDISLCSFSSAKDKKRKIQWSGANNSLVIFRNGTCSEIPGHKQSIGKTDLSTAFPTHEVEVSEGDMLYLFTDGYADQFGGPKGKKLKYKKLVELLNSIHTSSMAEQQETLKTEFENWRGGLEQVDDVTVIGFRI